MLKDIYKQHDNTFNLVSAYVILDKQGNRVATLAFKFPKDGAGRLNCFFHLIGVEMIKGFAGGYGYDKRSHAVSNAIKNLENTYNIQYGNKDFQNFDNIIKNLKNAFDKIGGENWDTVFHSLGYKIYQAV